MDLPTWQHICDYLTIGEIKQLSGTCKHLSLLHNISVITSKPISHYIARDLPKVMKFYPINISTEFDSLVDLAFDHKANKFCVFLYKVDQALFKYKIHQRYDIDPNMLEPTFKELETANDKRYVELSKLFFMSLAVLEIQSVMRQLGVDLDQSMSLGSGLTEDIPSLWDDDSSYNNVSRPKNKISTRIYNAFSSLFNIICCR